MAVSAQVRNAHRRVDRFVAEHGDELLRLPKARQSEILEDVYQGRGATARAKLRTFGYQAAQKRSQASKAAARTIFERRRLEVSKRIIDVMPKANRNRVMRTSHLFTRDDVNRLHKMSHGDFVFYVKNSAREASVTGVVASPFFYR